LPSSLVNAIPASATFSPARHREAAIAKDAQLRVLDPVFHNTAGLPATSLPRFLATVYSHGPALFRADAPAVAADPWLRELQNVDQFMDTYFLAFSDATVAQLKSNQSDAAAWPPNINSWGDLRGRFLSEGMSLVVRRENMDEMPRSPLEQALEALFNSAPSTTHAYISAPNAKALKAHTDPYDVFVLQVRQRK
jgi:hypothetical protein